MSIYDHIGGAPAVAAAVDDFYARVLNDPDLAPYFEGRDLEGLRRHQRAFLTAAVGGPDAYKGKSMKEAHEGLDVTAETFERVVEHLVATLTGLGVDQETIEAIGAKLAPLQSEIVTAPVQT